LTISIGADLLDSRRRGVGAPPIPPRACRMDLYAGARSRNSPFAIPRPSSHRHPRRAAIVCRQRFVLHTQKRVKERERERERESSFFRGHLLLNPHERSRRSSSARMLILGSRANLTRFLPQARPFWSLLFCPRYRHLNERIHFGGSGGHYYRCPRKQNNYLRIKRDINITIKR